MAQCCNFVSNVAIATGATGISSVAAVQAIRCGDYSIVAMAQCCNFIGNIAVSADLTGISGGTTNLTIGCGEQFIVIMTKRRQNGRYGCATDASLDHMAIGSTGCFHAANFTLVVVVTGSGNNNGLAAYFHTAGFTVDYAVIGTICTARCCILILLNGFRITVFGNSDFVTTVGMATVATGISGITTLGTGGLGHNSFVYVFAGRYSDLKDGGTNTGNSITIVNANDGNVHCIVDICNMSKPAVFVSTGIQHIQMPSLVTMGDQVLAAINDLRDVGDQDIAGQLVAGSLILLSGTVQILVTLGGSIVAAAVPVGEFLLGVEVQTSVGACTVQALCHQLEHILIAGATDIDLAGSFAIRNLADGGGVVVQVDHSAISGNAGNLEVAVIGSGEGIQHLLQGTHATGVVCTDTNETCNRFSQFHGGDGFIQLGQIHIVQSAGNHIAHRLFITDSHIQQLAGNGDDVLGATNVNGGGTRVDAGEGDFGGTVHTLQVDGGDRSIQRTGISICIVAVGLGNSDGLADRNGDIDLVHVCNGDHVDGRAHLDLGVAGADGSEYQTGFANDSTVQDLGDLAVTVGGGGVGIQSVQIAVGARADNQVFAVGQVSHICDALVAR